jgi:hypothetical protein
MGLGKLKQGLSSAKGKVADTADAISEKGREQFDKQVPAMLEKLTGLKPILKESGFLVGDVAMTLSIPPSLSITISQADGADNRITEVIESHELTKFQKTTLSTIGQMYAFNQTFLKFDYVIGDVDIEMSIPPAITAHLNPKDS